MERGRFSEAVRGPWSLGNGGQVRCCAQTGCPVRLRFCRRRTRCRQSFRFRCLDAPQGLTPDESRCGMSTHLTTPRRLVGCSFDVFPASERATTCFPFLALRCWPNTTRAHPPKTGKMTNNASVLLINLIGCYYSYYRESYCATRAQCANLYDDLF